MSLSNKQILTTDFDQVEHGDRDSDDEALTGLNPVDAR